MPFSGYRPGGGRPIKACLMLPDYRPVVPETVHNFQHEHPFRCLRRKTRTFKLVLLHLYTVLCLETICCAIKGPIALGWLERGPRTLVVWSRPIRALACRDHFHCGTWRPGWPKRKRWQQGVVSFPALRLPKSANADITYAAWQYCSSLRSTVVKASSNVRPGQLSQPLQVFDLAPTPLSDALILQPGEVGVE
jgi:hypothetical protein